ncbi:MULTISPECIES: hypothetical protein [unclassified Microbacterium]|uniref:hypothetical protein n=1 Tax=unclassified Microbacterium TaxID=2609290 RepID=UPI00214B553C|nr:MULTISPECIES: hypothetical protein [unclassified Microbacterium]MCR2785308.1 hypothetical protein [Microbacterium sp. zg.B96]WIM16836.1 hypothetical protein QNO11_04110 [Microbacterium sp. zg-B96]
MTDPRVPHRLITEEAVYGVILVSGMIVVSGTTASVVWEVFASVVATVMVFWAAHVYAGTVASYRAGVGHAGSLPDALRSALVRSSGLLVGAVLPTGVLLLGAARVIPDVFALWVALWVGVGVLAVIGYVVFRDRGSSITMSLLGSIGTAAFGLIMIALKVALH